MGKESEVRLARVILAFALATSTGFHAGPALSDGQSRDSSPASKMPLPVATSGVGPVQPSGQSRDSALETKVTPPVATSDAAYPLDAPYWQSIKNSKGATDFEGYLVRFPEGKFAEQAHKTISILNQQKLAVTAPLAPVSQSARPSKPRTRDMVASRPALVRAAPDMSAKLIIRIAEGEHLLVGDTASVNWYAVTVQGRDQGYVDAASVEEPHAYEVRQQRRQQSDAVTARIKLAGAAGLPVLPKLVPSSTIGFELVTRGDNAFAATKYADRVFAAAQYAKAMSLYRQAAELGNADAIERIGYVYHMGLGVTADYPEAMRWYRKAAALGNAMAMNQIGLLYHDGQGVAINDTEAMHWMHMAAKLGNSQALGWIGYFYATGQGVAKDCAAAHPWLERAADAGEQPAADWLKHNAFCSWK